MTPAVWNFICVCLQFLQVSASVCFALNSTLILLFHFCQLSQWGVRDSLTRDIFRLLSFSLFLDQLKTSFTLTFHAKAHSCSWGSNYRLCWKISAFGVSVTNVRIVCSACTVHDVPWYSTRAPVLWAVLAVGIVFICQPVLVVAHEFSWLDNQ